MSETATDTTVPDAEKEAPSTDLKAVFEEAKIRYPDAIDSWSSVREAYKEDIRFALLGEQWDPTLKAWRKRRRRQTLTYNQLAVLIRNAGNKVRKNCPSIKIHPDSSGANKKTATVIDGLCKRYQTRSYAPQVYSHAYTTRLAGGLGAWRVLPKEITRRGQTRTEIQLQRIEDPLALLLDPYITSIDGLDAEFAFHLVKISKRQFRREYPKCEPTSFSDAIETDSNSVVICEYWRREDDGRISEYILNGEEVIWSNQDYGGEYVPFIQIWGESVLIDGKRVLKSLCRDVADVQRFINYAKSEAADSIAKAPKQKIMLGTSHLENPAVAKIYNDPNADNAFYLPYDDSNGKTPPQSINPPPIPVGFVQLGNDAVSDLRQMVGIANPIEDIPATQSGKAIGLQLSERDLQLYGFVDALHVAIKATGVVMVDLIQAYKIVAEEISIQAADGTVKHVRINEQYHDDDADEDVYHDISSGDYAVEIDVGPAYRDQREESLERMVELLKTPLGERIAAAAPHLVVGLMDFDQSDELAALVKATVDPKILQAANPTSPQKAQIQLQSLQQRIEQADALIKQQHDEIGARDQEIQRLKDANETKLQIAREGNQTVLQGKELDAQTRQQDTQTRVDGQIMVKRIENAHDAAMVHHNPGAQLQVIT